MSTMKIVMMAGFILSIIIMAQATSVGVGISAGMVALGLLFLLIDNNFDKGDPL